MSTWRRRARAGLVAVTTCLGLAVAGLTVAASPAPAGRPPAAAVTNTARPTVAGSAEYDARLRADPGEWDASSPLSFTYRWLRDGKRIHRATGRTYRPGRDDLGHRLSVEVRATGDDGRGTATSARTGKVRRAPLTSKRRPHVRGVARYTHTVHAGPGRWSARPRRTRYQWLRGGKEIHGATHAAYRISPRDVGARLRVRVTVKAPGHHRAHRSSARTAAVRHRVDVRRVVTYRVETRGRITTGLATFKRLAQQTYRDPRGWRGSGIEFRRVARGGSFSLVLAAASSVPSFSSACSSTYSCRVGRYVIINQERWKHATPPWNAAHGSLRGYRHMVVNHETGHWLGLGHATCPGPGRPAPVMQQQSKGLAGCHFNAFPTLHELASRTPHARAVGTARAAARATTAVSE